MGNKKKAACKAAHIKALISCFFWFFFFYPSSLFFRGGDWVGAWMWPLVAVRFAGFGGGRGGSRRGHSLRGAFMMGRRRMRRPTVWRGRRRRWWRRRRRQRRLFFLFDRCRSVVCEKRLKRHGGGLKVILLLSRRVFWHLWSSCEK